MWSFYVCWIDGIYYCLVFFFIVGWSNCLFIIIFIEIFIHKIMIFSLVLLQILDEAAVQKVFLKSLDNYIKWCNYLCIQPVWSRYGFLKYICYTLWLLNELILVNDIWWLRVTDWIWFFCSLEAVNKEKKLLFVSLYFLIWGEAANIRFLPECLCYIFHHVS